MKRQTISHWILGLATPRTHDVPPDKNRIRSTGRGVGMSNSNPCALESTGKLVPVASRRAPLGHPTFTSLIAITRAQQRLLARYTVEERRGMLMVTPTPLSSSLNRLRRELRAQRTLRSPHYEATHAGRARAKSRQRFAPLVIGRRSGMSWKPKIQSR